MNQINSSDMQESTYRQRSLSLGIRAHPSKTLSTENPSTPIDIEEKILTKNTTDFDHNQPKQSFNFEKLRNTLRVESNSPFRLGSVSIKSIETRVNKSYNYSKQITPLRTDHLSTEESFREFTPGLSVYDNLDVSEFAVCSLDRVITHRLHPDPRILSDPDKCDINISQEVSQLSSLIDVSLSLTEENVKANSPRDSLLNYPMTYSTIETLNDNQYKPYSNIHSITKEEWILGSM